MARWTRGPRLFLIIAFAVAAAAAAAALGDGGVRAALRLTARTSLVLFCLAFTASALHRLWPSAWTAWQLANRRVLGLAFAASHLVHAIAIVALAELDPVAFGARTSRASLVAGGIGYAFIALMAATSFDGAVRWLGARRWKALHTAGGYYLWASFAQAMVQRVPRQPGYAVGVLLVAAALLVRWLPRCPFARSARQPT